MEQLIERKWGEMYTQALEETEYQYESMHVMKWVSKSVQFVLRRTNLSWSHHKEAASLPPQQQDYWLGYAEKKVQFVTRVTNFNCAVDSTKGELL